MTFQAYLDTIKTKTGKSPEDFRTLAAQKGLTNYSEIMAWLKADFELGHGHANVIAQLLVNMDKIKASPEDKLAALFEGPKAHWRPAYDQLAAQVSQFGADVGLWPNRTYVSVQRGSKKFAVLQPSAAEHFDIGIKLKGAAPSGRFEDAGKWNVMVTHRVSITAPQQIDAEVLAWLKQAYDAAAGEEL